MAYSHACGSDDSMITRDGGDVGATRLEVASHAACPRAAWTGSITQEQVGSIHLARNIRFHVNVISHAVSASNVPLFITSLARNGHAARIRSCPPVLRHVGENSPGISSFNSSASIISSCNRRCASARRCNAAQIADTPTPASATHLAPITVWTCTNASIRTTLAAAKTLKTVQQVESTFDLVFTARSSCFSKGSSTTIVHDDLSASAHLAPRTSGFRRRAHPQLRRWLFFGPSVMTQRTTPASEDHASLARDLAQTSPDVTRAACRARGFHGCVEILVQRPFLWEAVTLPRFASVSLDENEGVVTRVATEQLARTFST